ncbi:PREDICTED: uncharacterized protein LOC108757454 [Trachymyrmex cornetzi]|uniref:uncharacterized protein LOC108757454 n=1 Tax=Trachymyrmex cornetzi TaxID=471704 RepID=UPI00084F5930|nr:PREDICTED: uncharacterized protein LOC108757454 [Trachymyrmex cornetzi]
MNAIGPNLRDGKKTRKNYYICERHFDDGNLHRIPMNILKDGKEVTLLRRRPMLKSTSVPYIFPGSRLIDSNNLESSSIIDSNNLPMECTLENGSRLIDSNNLESSSIIDSNNLPMECTLENIFNTTVLLKEWNARPSYESMGSWGVTKTTCGLLFILLESTSEQCSNIVQRSLFVKNDMTIEVP